MDDEKIFVKEESDGENAELRSILEALLMAAGKPLSLEYLSTLLMDDLPTTKKILKTSLQQLQEEYCDRGVELVEVASGFRFQARAKYSELINRLWEEKPQKYSRALLETLALIAYRQPITRGDIEQVRGVAVSSSIIKTLMEREWVKVVGHREVPGRPAIYGTTKQFLDYFNISSLDQMPALPEMREIDVITKELSKQLNLNEESADGGKPREVLDSKATTSDSLL